MVPKRVSAHTVEHVDLNRLASTLNITTTMSTWYIPIIKRDIYGWIILNITNFLSLYMIGYHEILQIVNYLFLFGDYVP